MKLPVGYVPGVGVVAPTARGGFGERLLRGMGWAEGEGLGKDGTGITRCLEVKKKEDTAGVGKSTTYAWEKKWWEAAYDSKLRTLAPDAQEPFRHGSDESSEDELPSAHAPGRRAAAPPAAEQKEEQHRHHPDGTRASEGAAVELRIAAALRRAATRGVGRYGGREGKLARIRSQEAALALRAGISHAAPVGGEPSAPSAANEQQQQRQQEVSPPSATAPAEASGKRRKRQAAEEAAADSLEAVAKGKKGKKKRQRHEQPPTGEAAAVEAQPPAAAEEEQQEEPKPRKKRREAAPEPSVVQAAPPAGAEGGRAGDKSKAEAAVEGPRSQQQPPAAAAVPAPEQGTRAWWGAARFVSGGTLEGVRSRQQQLLEQQRQQQQQQKAQASAAPEGFTEDQQEGLYAAAQAAKTVGKQGLGVSSAPRKVAGARWAGSRRVFDEAGDDSADTTEAAVAVKPEERGVAAKEGAQQGSEAKEEEEEEGRGEERPVKWRKLIRRALQQAPQERLPLRALQKAVLRGWDAAPLDRRKALKRELAAVVAQSSKFHLVGKVVHLRCEGGSC